MTSAVLAFERVKARGWEPKTIVDAGAYAGGWSERTEKIFPDAEYVLIEPIPTLDLLRLCSKKMWTSVECALASETGTSNFNAHGMQGSLLPDANGNAWGTPTMIQTARLDDVLLSIDAKPPILLKLDVQGSELEVLKSSPATLQSVDVIQCEVSFIQYAPGVPNAAEIIAHLSSAGFILTDWFDMTERAQDGQPLQCDIIMMRPHLISHSWSLTGDVPWA